MTTWPWLFPDNLCQPFDWQKVFGNPHPVEIDLGAGDGSFILQYAAQHPGRNFLAVERLLGRARKIAKRAARQNLTNLRVLRLESDYIIRHLVSPASVNIIHLMFPDPWPKQRHADRRLVQPAFVQAIARALGTSGAFRLTTDDLDYFTAASEHLNASPLLEGASIWPLENYPQTDFQAEFARQNRPFYRAQWIRY